MESRVESNEDGSVSVNITVQQPLLLVQMVKLEWARPCSLIICTDAIHTLIVLSLRPLTILLSSYCKQ